MKLKGLFAAGAAVLMMASCQQGLNTDVKLQTASDSASYYIGQFMGSQGKQMLDQQPEGADIDVDIMVAAYYEMVKSDSVEFDQQAASVFLNTYFQELMAKENEPLIQKEKDYLAENKTKPGIVETASGLQYEILVEGNGPIPSSTDKVKAHYHGTLPDGTVFDSSVERGQPFECSLSGGVIKGWLEALAMMPVGSKWRIYVPSELGYGERGAGAQIGPYQTLIFELEVLEIVK